MRHPLALQAELVLRGRKEAGARIYAPRPTGQLIWLHLGLPEVVAMAAPLIDRVIVQRPDVSFLVTHAPDLGDVARDMGPRVTGAGPLPDAAREAKAFIAHFQPDMGLWAGGNLMAPPLAAAAEADVPMAYIAAREDGVPAPGFRLRTSVTSVLLHYFAAVYAETANAERRLASYRLDPAVLHLTGPMQMGTLPPACNEEDLDHLRELLRGRTLWAALHVRANEVATMLEARARVARFDPRALMILHPEGPGASQAIEDHLDQNVLVADWSDGDMPSEMTQVLVSQDAADIGLWHRLAPVTVMGASFGVAYGGVTPWPAAGLGSAILFGPNVTAHQQAYDRLQQVGAARRVAGADELAAVLLQLNAPDRVAAMAHAGWKVATAGAEATDRVVDLIQDTLDAGGGR